MIFQKKKVTRSLSLLHHRATYGGESKQTDPSLQPHETVYKLLTDRGKKEVARPNQPTVSSPGGRRRQTRVVRENLQETAGQKKKGLVLSRRSPSRPPEQRVVEKKVVEDS